MSDPLYGVWLGRRRYSDVLELQQSLFEACKFGRAPNVVLFVEHEAVVTLGRGSHLENLLASRAELERIGIAVHEANRGGDVTLHAPGQLVAYPILRLGEGRRDVRRYVRSLEAVMQRLVAPYGIAAGPFAPHVGVWADRADPSHFAGDGALAVPVKIGAIGVRISRWTTMHGFALNLSTDLSLFRVIVPCGIKGHGVGSVESLVGAAPDVAATAHRAHGELARELSLAAADYFDHARRPLGSWPGELGLPLGQDPSSTTIA